MITQNTAYLTAWLVDREAFWLTATPKSTTCFHILERGVANYSPWPSPTHCLFLLIKFYSNTTMPIHLQAVFDYFKL